MPEENAYLSHLEITFASGNCLLAIAPVSFDLDPSRGDAGFVYVQVRFETEFCKGVVNDAIYSERFNELLTALTHLRRGESAPVSFGNLWFDLEGDWNAKEGVVAFNACMPARLHPGSWCLLHEAHHYRGSMKTCVELEFWMEPPELEEPIAEVSAVVEHMRALRSGETGISGCW